jgi:hypothetical protein
MPEFPTIAHVTLTVSDLSNAVATGLSKCNVPTDTHRRQELRPLASD